MTAMKSLAIIALPVGQHIIPHPDGLTGQYLSNGKRPPLGRGGLWFRPERLGVRGMGEADQTTP